MRTITENKDTYSIKFEYDKKVSDGLSSIPARTFNWQNSTWTVPKQYKEEVEKFAKRFKFQINKLAAPRIANSFDGLPTLDADIPLKMSLYDYQKEGVAYNLKNKRVLIGDQMGLGKTAQAIASVTAVDAFPCLVICPSTLTINWEREFAMWTDHRAMVLSDSIKHSWDTFYQMQYADVFIVNYESLKKYFVATINTPRGEELKLKHIQFINKINLFKSIIVDESHRVKDADAQQSKFVAGIAKDKEYKYLISGTPVLNKTEELIPQLCILDQIQQFGGVAGFRKQFCGKDADLDKLQSLLKQHCFYRREKSEVLKELPPKTRQVILCDITTRKEYDDALTDLRQYLIDYKDATNQEVRRAMRGEVMVRIGILKEISARGKIDTVANFITDANNSGEKVILFSHLRDVQAELKKCFPEAVTVLGEDDMRTRQSNIDAFQNNPDVLNIICSIKAAGVGITLTASSLVSFIELPWHSGDSDQCEDRAHRKGQYNNVTCVYFLGKDTIDEYIYNLINEKRETANAITGALDDVEESIQNEVIDILSKII